MAVLLLLVVLAFWLPISASGQAVMIFAENHPVSWVTSTEQVVQGTVSLNGTITSDIASKLKWAAENTMTQICSQFSIVSSQALLELTWQYDRRSMDIPFRMLPPLGWGGECARSLVESSNGGAEPPWNDVKTKPLFRTMFEKNVQELLPGVNPDRWLVRIWRVVCESKLVRMHSFHPSFSNLRGAEGSCENYKPGWEVYYQKSLTAAATPGAQIGGQEDNFYVPEDKCNVYGSGCVCLHDPDCVWRQHSAGGMRCLTRPSGDSERAVSCPDCTTQAGCPSICKDYHEACSCATQSHCDWIWDRGACDDAPGGPTNSNDSSVSCLSCYMQAKCDADRPEAVTFRPYEGFYMWKTGSKAQMEIRFDKDLGVLPSFESTVELVCGRNNELPRINGGNLHKYRVPFSGLYVQGKTLHVNTSTVHVFEESQCQVMMDAGVVVGSDADGNLPLPSKIMEFGNYRIVMPDHVPPTIMKFDPMSAATGVSTSRETITFKFDERIRLRPGFSAKLQALAIFGVNEGDPKPLPVELLSADRRQLKLNVRGLLEPGKLYVVTVAAGSLEDEASNVFQGVLGENYFFRAAGIFVEERQIDREEKSFWTLPVVLGLTGGIVLLMGTVAAVAIRFYCLNNLSADAAKVQPEDPEFVQNSTTFSETQFREKQIADVGDDLDENTKRRASFVFNDAWELGIQEDEEDERIKPPDRVKTPDRHSQTRTSRISLQDTTDHRDNDQRPASAPHRASLVDVAWHSRDIRASRRSLR